MRIIVFFDLPILTKRERRQYAIFRKYLLGLGFIMVQKSVYSKITLNRTGMETVLRSLRHNKPLSGNVQILTVSERQYQGIEYLVGESQKEVVDSAERLVII